MKKKMSNKAFAGIWSAVIAVVVVVTIVANLAAMSYTSIISTFLGHDTYKVEQLGESMGDSQYFKSAYSSPEELVEASTELGKRLQAEGMVLLMNENNALPLGESQKISLFSESSVDLIYGGTGSGAIDTSTVPTLKEAFESIGYTVNPTLWDFYQGNHEQYSRVIPSNLPGVDHAYFVNECPVSAYTQSVRDSYSSYGDAAIVVIACSGGEGLDLITASTASDGNYLALTQEERDMLDMIQNSDAFDKIIIVLNATNPVELGNL